MTTTSRAVRPSPARCLLLLLALCALLDRGGSFLLGRWMTPQSETLRNPYFRRLWPEHVEAPPRRGGERLWIVIANSQGYGREIRDAETYSALLLRELRRHGPARVLNWSIPGGCAPEYVLLGAVARQLDPDLVLLMADPYDFIRQRRVAGGAPRSLDSFASDLWRLLARPDVVRNLPESFVDHHAGTADFVQAAFARAISTWRFRDLPLSFSLAWEPLQPFELPRSPETWAYSDEPSGTVTRRIGPDRRAERPRRAANRPAAHALSRPLIAETLESLAGSARRVVVTRMPFERRRSPEAAFFADLRARAPELGIETFDYARLLPAERFVTRSHVDSEGHRRIARRLIRDLGT